MANLSLKNINKSYDGTTLVVKDFNLDIQDQEFIVLVGPSGCGKSTTLRMIAGLEEITSGEIYIDGNIVNEIEPKDRDIAMVFQNYALYPHMTVFENMAFGLKMRKTSRNEIKQNVLEAAKILDIEYLLDRRPRELSGGQRQRVALGRAIVRKPKVFLMDEPLSNLDAKLRVQMRAEITKLHDKIKTTFVYVTHDQTEAMTMGSVIVVMKDGIIQQVDNPQNLYDHPQNIFVAQFIGSPQMNIFEADILYNENDAYLILGEESRLQIPDNIAKKIKKNTSIDKIILGVRPECLNIIDTTENKFGLKATVDFVEHLGSDNLVYLNAEGIDASITARVSSKNKVKKEDIVYLTADAEDMHFFDNETKESLLL